MKYWNNGEESGYIVLSKQNNGHWKLQVLSYVQFLSDTRQHIFQQVAVMKIFFYGRVINEKLVHFKHYPKNKENLCNCACFKTRASGL